MDFYEHIEAYIEGTLDAGLHEEMKSALAADTKLKEALENYIDAKKISEGLLELNVMETIESLEQVETKKEKRKFKWWWIFIPVVLALIGLFLWLNHEAKIEKEDQVIFAANYVRPIDDEALKGIDTSLMSDFQLGKYYFSLNDFEKSETSLLQFLSTTQNQDSISLGNYWLGHVYLNLGEWEKAKKINESVKDTSISSILKQLF